MANGEHTKKMTRKDKTYGGVWNCYLMPFFFKSKRWNWCNIIWNLWKINPNPKFFCIWFMKYHGHIYKTHYKSIIYKKQKKIDYHKKVVCKIMLGFVKNNEMLKVVMKVCKEAKVKRKVLWSDMPKKKSIYL